MCTQERRQDVNFCDLGCGAERILSEVRGHFERKLNEN